MDCRELEPLLIALALGEQTQEESARCREHIEECPDCAKALARYQELAGMLVAEPMASPTASESAALASALAGVELRRRGAPRAANSVPQGFGEFVAASLAAFVLVTALLALQIRGAIDIGAALASAGALRVLGAVTLIVIITSFVPIAVTAHRRPLNGMTFRK
jgi:anti-sigma factor RsiW